MHTLTVASGRIKDLRSGEEHSDPHESVQTRITAAGSDVTLNISDRHPRAEGDSPMAISDVKECTHLAEEQVEELGRELDAIREESEESRGADDAACITG